MLIRLRGKGIESRIIGPLAQRPADGVPTGRSRQGARALAGDGHDRDKSGRDDDDARHDPRQPADQPAPTPCACSHATTVWLPGWASATHSANAHGCREYKTVDDLEPSSLESHQRTRRSRHRSGRCARRRGTTGRGPGWCVGDPAGRRRGSRVDQHERAARREGDQMLRVFQCSPSGGSSAASDHVTTCRTGRPRRGQIYRSSPPPSRSSPRPESASQIQYA